MKNFKEKTESLIKIRDELDDYVWKIFHRYIDMEKIHFNSPDSWEPDDNTIYFNGSDGCMGCYDNMSCTIPLKFFVDSDDAFSARAIEIENTKKKKETKRKRTNTLQEKKLLKKLKEKYE